MISVAGLSLRIGRFALEDVTFSVPTGAYAVLMGRTGAGKSSILEAICGLRPIRGGRIMLNERDVTALRPGDRGIGYVPQDGAIFTSMTVRENIAFAPWIRGWSAAEIDGRVAELAQLLAVSHLLDRKAQGLSGGEAQRVALGRALAFGPPVLLLDEPLSALDDQTRSEMHELLAWVRTRTGVTTLHVTHNAGDAHRLADVVLVLRDGKISSEAP